MSIDIEKGQEFKSPVHEMMQGCCFCETTNVSKSRKIKHCRLCRTLIPIGSASNGAKLINGEYIQVDFCKKCEETYKTELAEMYDGKLDDY